MTVKYHTKLFFDILFYNSASQYSSFVPLFGNMKDVKNLLNKIWRFRKHNNSYTRVCFSIWMWKFIAVYPFSLGTIPTVNNLQQYTSLFARILLSDIIYCQHIKTLLTKKTYSFLKIPALNRRITDFKKSDLMITNWNGALKSNIKIYCIAEYEK